MRVLPGCVLIGALVLVAAGCGSNRPKYYDGPTVEAFSGQLTQDGKPVTFPEDEEVIVRFTTLEGAKTFGVPIKSDGTFSIGWMPVGKMAARLERGPKDPAKQTGPPRGYDIPRRPDHRTGEDHGLHGRAGQRLETLTEEPCGLPAPSPSRLQLRCARTSAG
jgi:hypothetical protein